MKDNEVCNLSYGFNTMKLFWEVDEILVNIDAK